MDRSPTRSPRVPHARLAAITLALTGAALAACQPDPPPPAPVTSAAPAPAATSAAPVTSATSTTASAVRAAPSNSPFSIVARSPDAFELYPLKGALLVDAAGFLAVLDEGPLRQLPGAMKGLEKGECGRILGLYPDGAWLVAGGGAGTYRWSGDRWAENKLLREHETLLDLTAWGDKGAVAAVAAPGNDMRFVLAAGKLASDVPVPVPAPPGAGGADGEGEPCKVRMKPKPGHVMLAGLPGGELYAAGYACEPGGHGGAIVERWESKKAQGTVEALPRPESGHDPELGGVLARSPEEVLVYGTEGVPPAPYLARFDGKAWTLLLPSPPFGGGIDTLAAADDGTLWAAAGGEAWKKAPSGAWEKVPLPGALTVQAVWPRTSADVWAAGRESDGKARALLLRTGGAGGAGEKEALRLPPRNAMAGTIATSKRFFATAACEKVFVSLYEIGPSKDPVTGKPADIPKDFSARKPIFAGELAGLAPIVDDDGTSLRVGVAAPSREIGRSLVAAYQEKNPRSTPSLFCHEASAGKQAIKIP